MTTHMQLAFLESCNSIKLSSCAPLFIIPTRLWFFLAGTTFCRRTLLGCKILQVLDQMLHFPLQSTFSNQEAFHGEGSKQRVHADVHTHVNMYKRTA